MPRTYKTWEMVKMLTENPNLKFQTSNGYDAIVDNNGNVSSSAIRPSLLCINTQIEWELVQEPVPFMEAVKAFHDGATIRCESICGSNRYKKRTMSGHLGYKINPDSMITSTEILEGKWYIEE